MTHATADALATTIDAGVMDLQPAHLRSTRSQIVAYVDEIAAAAKTGRDRRVFYSLAVSRLRSAMNSSAAAIWQRSSDGCWTLAAGDNVPSELLLPASDENQSFASSVLQPSSSEELAGTSIAAIERRFDEAERLVRGSDESVGRGDASMTLDGPHFASPPLAAILEAVAAESHAVLVPPAGIAADGRPENPTDFALVFAPIATDGDASAAELYLMAVQPPIGGPATHRGYLRFVVQIAELVGEFARGCDLRELRRREAAFRCGRDMLGRLQKHRGSVRLTVGRLSKAAVAAVLPGEEFRIIAAEAVQFLQADEACVLCGNRQRMSIAPRANRMPLEPISETAEAIRQAVLQRLSVGRDTAESEPTVSFASNPDPPWANCHQLLGSAAAAVIPIDAEAFRGDVGNWVCLVVWWYRLSPGQTRESLEGDLREVAPAVRLATQWARGGEVERAVKAIEARRTRRPVLRRLAESHRFRTAALLVALAAACCVPVPTRITAPAVLTPASQRSIYSPASATVDQVLVQYGQRVRTGDVLCRLRSDSLDEAYEAAVAERLEALQRESDIELRLLRGTDLTAQQRGALEGELQTLRSVDSARDRRIDALERQRLRLEVRSPIDGVVGTWQVEGTLAGRTVSAGAALLGVYDPQGGWRFEARLAQRDVAAYVAAVGGTDRESTSQRWRCRLDSHPGRWIAATESTDTPLVLHTDAAGALVAPIGLAIDADEVPQLTPGAEAVAHLNVGRSPVLWAVSRDAVLRGWAYLRLWI